MVKTFSALAAALALCGCAALNQLNSDVSSYSQWPAGRVPGSYAFERLPSQLSQPERQRKLEDAARRALESAGFSAAGDDKAADVTVQLGARVDPNERPYYDDPFWWRGGLIYGVRGRGYWSPGLAMSFSNPSYEREVALLIRDRKSGQALYEARASNDGGSPFIDALLPAMYEAVMKDFPNGGVNPRRVTTDVAR